MKLSNKKKWLKVIEFALVGIATWLDPSAGGLIFLLKLCFQILAALQKDDSKIVRYEIIFAPEAAEDITTLKASDRAKALDAIETYLRYEPEKISQSRIKRLREMQRPQYRLRIDDLRAFYDVSYTDEEGGVVEILRVREKSEAMRWLADFGRREE